MILNVFLIMLDTVSGVNAYVEAVYAVMSVKQFYACSREAHQDSVNAKNALPRNLLLCMT